MAGGHEVPLYGGALTCELPRTLTDASAFREVPDHQEVWVDTSSDRTIVIEILEAKDANGGALSLAGDDDEEADKKERHRLLLAVGLSGICRVGIGYHQDVYILTKGRIPASTPMPFLLSLQDPKVLESRSVAAEEVPHLPATARCLAGIGEQTVAKFREDRGNRVRIHAAAIRLPDVSTDILITLNDPVHVDPDSSSAEAPVPSEPAEDVFRMLLRSFRFRA
eukprot:s5977_g2.t2